MRSKHFFKLGMVGTAIGMIALTQACGGSSTSPTGGTGGKASSTTSTSMSSTKASSTSSTTGPTSGPGGAGGAGGGATATNTSFGSAQMLMVDPMTATPGTLPDPMTALYYSFTGKAGDFIQIEALAEGILPPTHDINDPTVTDTVVTLYLPDMATIWAQDDDEWPRNSTDSELFTQLPMDGTHYFTVEDCNGYASTHAGVACNPMQNITNLNFQTAVVDLTALKADFVGATAGTALKYTVPSGQKAGNYGFDVLDGDFAAQSDVDKFTFTPPADTVSPDVAHTRNRAYFWVQPYGAGDGDGTAVDVVLTAKDMSGNILAQADQHNYSNGDDPTNGPMQFSFPFDDQFGNMIGSNFELDVSVSNSTAIAPMKSFYSIEHFEGGYQYGQPETEGPKGLLMNDTALTAQSLTSPAMAAGGFSIDGNIAALTDTDWYTMTIPTGNNPTTGKPYSQYYIACEAARDGSGLQGFTAKLQSSASGAAGPMTMLTTLGPEVANPKTELQSNPQGMALPAGATSLFLEVSLTGTNAGQSPTNAGSYYHCQVDVF